MTDSPYFQVENPKYSWDVARYKNGSVELHIVEDDDGEDVLMLVDRDPDGIPYGVVDFHKPVVDRLIRCLTTATQYMEAPSPSITRNQARTMMQSLISQENPTEQRN